MVNTWVWGTPLSETRTGTIMVSRPRSVQRSLPLRNRLIRPPDCVREHKETDFRESLETRVKQGRSCVKNREGRGGRHRRRSCQVREQGPGRQVSMHARGVSKPAVFPWSVSPLCARANLLLFLSGSGALGSLGGLHGFTALGSEGIGSGGRLVHFGHLLDGQNDHRIKRLRVTPLKERSL